MVLVLHRETAPKQWDWQQNSVRLVRTYVVFASLREEDKIDRNDCRFVFSATKRLKN